MKGINKLAYKLLVNDTAKFTALLLGITSAVYLMMFVTSMFSGAMKRATSTVINIGAPLGDLTSSKGKFRISMRRMDSSWCMMRSFPSSRIPASARNSS